MITISEHPVKASCLEMLLPAMRSATSKLDGPEGFNLWNWNLWDRRTYQGWIIEAYKRVGSESWITRVKKHDVDTWLFTHEFDSAWHAHLAAEDLIKLQQL